MGDTQDRVRLTKAYEARASKLDDINVHSPWHRLFRALTGEHLASLRPPNLTAIDLAAGTGITAELLCDLGYQVLAVETLDAMLRILKLKATEKGFDVLDLDISEAITLAPTGFGLATCTQALNFFPRVDPVVAFASACLDPGGLVYVDVDTPYRWAVIEGLAGRPSNALSILNEGVDRDREIVGADYFFHSEHEILKALEHYGFSNVSVEGILPFAPLLHILNESADFLDLSNVAESARHYASAGGLSELRELDARIKALVPPELCGWLRFTATRQ